MENAVVPNTRLNRSNSFKNKNEQVVGRAAKPVSTAFYRSVPSALYSSCSLASKSLVSSFSILHTMPG